MFLCSEFDNELFIKLYEVSFNEAKFAVTPCEDIKSSVGSEENQWLTTQLFDQYALIIFRSFFLCY